MKLTPLDIRHQEFRRAMRGYSEEQVDVFLDEVADEFDRLFQDNIELRERIQFLEEQVASYEKLKETLNNTLVSAQQQADSTRANANKEGELVLRDAELKARGIVSEAYSEKQRVQQSLIQLRQIEEDFRFKFRSLLEAHINLLAQDGVLDEPRRFRELATDVEHQLEPSTPDGASASPSADPSSDASTEAVVELPQDAAVVPAPPQAAPASDEDAVVVVSDEPDLSGYLVGLPDPEAVPEESAGRASSGEAVADDEPAAHKLAGDEAAGDHVADDEPAAHKLAGDEAAGDHVAGDEAKGSTVRRFLFGKRDKPEPEGLFEQKDRDFEW